jgi:hypothetical protein
MRVDGWLKAIRQDKASRNSQRNTSAGRRSNAG